MVTRTMDSILKEGEIRVDRDLLSLIEVEVVEVEEEEEADKVTVHLEETEVDMDKQDLMTTTRVEVGEEILTVDTTREELEQVNHSSSKVAMQGTAMAVHTVATNNSLNSNSLTNSSSSLTTVAILKFHHRIIDRPTEEAISHPSNLKRDQDLMVPLLLVISTVDLLDRDRVRDKHHRIKDTGVTVVILDKGDNRVEVNTGDINRLAG